MERLIDGNEFVDQFQCEIEMGISDPLESVNNAMDRCNIVNAEPVVHAHWRFDSGCGGVKHYRCSRCGRTVCSFGKPLLEEFPYCHCGAKMGEAEDD